jgi:NADH-quinone oxidoreductase subunit A
MAVYLIAVLLLVAAMLGLSYLLGQRHSDRSTGKPYESGIIPTESVATHFNVMFYLVAVLFVLFDIETIFVFAWSVALRELGWQGYMEMLIFIFVLLSALFYLWRLGVLDWGTSKGASKIRGQRI